MGRALIPALLAALLAGCASHGAPPAAGGPRPVASGARGAPVRPAALQPGATVALVAPASPPDSAAVETARRGLESQGFRVKVAPNVGRRVGYLAGDDEERAAAFMEAWTDPEVAAVFCLSGGYGVTRILPLLDFAAIARHPKVFTGFSDITALHLAIQNQAGLVTFHAPTHSAAVGRDPAVRPFQVEWLWRQIYGPSYFDEAGTRRAEGLLLPSAGAAGEAATLVSGRAVGRLTGGNLTLVAALAGTPHALRPDGAILFLEDVGEEPYRIDRMLSTLELGGVLDRVAGVVLGAFTGSEPANPATSLTLDQVLHRYFAGRPYPVLTGFPVGHIVDNVTLPYGVLAELDAGARTLRLLEDPVRLR